MHLILKEVAMKEERTTQIRQEGEVVTIYPLDDCLNSLAGLNALRKLHVLLEGHAQFTTVREGKVTTMGGIPVLVVYHLHPEQEALRLRMLEGAHGYWRGGKYYLTYAKRRRRRY